MSNQLVGLAVVALLVSFALRRRMRPQPVRPERIGISGALIVLLIGGSLVGTGGRIIGDPVALLLVPVFVAAGAAAGYYLVRTMTFWTDESSGQLWMRGGLLFAAILLATVGLRFGVRDIAYGSIFGPAGAAQGPASHGLLYDLSADLLFLSLGLWTARAVLLLRRHRAHARARAGA